MVAVGFADSVSQQTAFLWVVAESFDPATTDVDVAAANVANNVSAFFSPTGCISRSRSGNEMTLRAVTCAGPMGLNNTTGAVSVTLDRVSNGVQISLSSSTLKSTTLVLSIDATALYTQNGDARLLTVNSMTNGNSGQYTVSWMKGGDCATIDGAVASSPHGTVSNTFSQYVVCRTGCPRGGTVTRQDPQTGVSVTTTYNGSASATFVRSDGTRGTVTLACQ